MRKQPSQPSRLLNSARTRLTGPAIEIKPAVPQQVCTYDGVQYEQGWFWSSSKETPTQLRVNVTTGRLDIRGGVPKQNSVRTFNLYEVLQVVWNNSQCFTVGNKLTARDPHTLYNCVFVFKKQSLDPVEIKFRKPVIQYLTECLANMKRKMEPHEPLKHMFVIKQSFIPQSSNKITTFAQTDRKSRLFRQSQPMASPFPVVEQVSLSDDGAVCMQFRVKKWKGDASSAKPEERILYVRQNNDSYVTEIVFDGGTKVYALLAFEMDTRGGGKRVKISYLHDQVTVIEFESMYKAYQFLQIIQLFRIRAGAKVPDESNMPESSCKFLMPPAVLNRMLTRQESPSNQQDFTTERFNLIKGKIPLEILCITWNQAREVHQLDCEKMFPDHSRYNIIVYGCQEVVDKEE